MVTFPNKLKKIAEKKQTRIILSLDLTCNNNELLNFNIKKIYYKSEQVNTECIKNSELFYLYKNISQ